MPGVDGDIAVINGERMPPNPVRLFGVLLLTNLAAFSQAPDSTQSASSTHSVVVTITDQSSKPLKDLDKEQFRAFEDGQPVKILRLEHIETPITFALVVDVSGSMQRNRNLLVNASIAVFEATKMNNDNKGFLVTFNDESVASGKVLTKEEVLKVLQSDDIRGGTALYDAVVATANHLARVSPQPPERIRRLMFLLSDGSDNASRDTKKQAIEVLLQTGVLVLPIVIKGEHSKGPKTMRELADTAGRTIELDAPAKLGDDISAILSSQYLLTYELSPLHKSAKFHEMKIMTNDSKVDLRAPKGYYVGK